MRPISGFLGDPVPFPKYALPDPVPEYVVLPDPVPKYALPDPVPENREVLPDPKFLLERHGQIMCIKFQE